MAQYTLDQLSKKYLLDKRAAERSHQWFNQQVQKLSQQVSARSLMANAQRRQDYFIPGQMYMYFYHPVGVDTLPYYDQFPLVIPFSQDAETFTGINFHYLPPRLRMILLVNLLDFATDPKVKSDDTRLKLQWSFIRGVSKYKGVQHAVKKYRKDHVASSFLAVPATQWFNAVMLPVEQFATGKNMINFDKNLVWRDIVKYN